MKPRSRHLRGLTLLELLIVLVLLVILGTAISYGFVGGLDIQRVQARRQAAQHQTETLERHLKQMLQGATLSATPADTRTWFVATQNNSVSNLSSNSMSEIGSDELTFTTLAPGVPLASLSDTDDFETQQRTRGPAGGVAEVAWSTVPVGNAGNQTGLFERLQRPGDGDRTQGGRESVLSADVDNIHFQFWNGTDWTPTWDTTAGTRRLPAAVKISYVLKNDVSPYPHVLIVPIPGSDVDAQNPVTTTTATTP